ncbi:MAG: hypothetical protein FWC34_10275 [Bacteroidetes bacterium]|nr:hypothetical protein [Bacteroidota bacterium]MCL2302128.1 hypothetical protein [Lentimicrobiaceae bacterium]
MKYRFLLLIIFIGSNFGMFAQESQKKHFSPEFKVSFHIRNGGLMQVQDLFGFGVGISNAFFNQKRCNLIVGLEYNGLFRQPSFAQEFESFYNFIGIPVNVRVNFGKKVKFFIEAGAFFEPVVFEKRKFTEKGTIIERETIVYKPDFGISGGVGLRIPVKKYEILIKSDYKWGLRSTFDRSFIASYNQYWRLAVGFKI